MFHLIARSQYNGDSLTRLRIKPGFLQHEYYVIAIKGPLDIADIIQQYNIVTLTIENEIIYVSASLAHWRFLLRIMYENMDEQSKYIADNITALLPTESSLVKIR